MSARCTAWPSYRVASSDCLRAKFGVTSKLRRDRNQLAGWPCCLSSPNTTRALEVEPSVWCL
eukprot:scaffold331263_cov29-Prasinocladus_malaysianus.AAC.1